MRSFKNSAANDRIHDVQADQDELSRVVNEAVQVFGIHDPYDRAAIVNAAVRVYRAQRQRDGLPVGVHEP